MDASSLAAWRKSQRERLIAARLAVTADELESWRRNIDASLARSFPGLARMRVAFCWPIRNEYDARHLVRSLRERGATTALPVVVARGAPLVFREWHPGVLRLPTGIFYAQGVKTNVLFFTRGTTEAINLVAQTFGRVRVGAGDEVLVTGYELGAGHWGGFAAFVRVPAEWVVALPTGLDSRTAMIYGTAGFTASGRRGPAPTPARADAMMEIDPATVRLRPCRRRPAPC
mgnify:CR=1 FL=1